jgi:hypothetical protein
MVLFEWRNKTGKNMKHISKHTNEQNSDRKTCKIFLYDEKRIISEWVLKMTKNSPVKVTHTSNFPKKELNTVKSSRRA